MDAHGQGQAGQVGGAAAYPHSGTERQQAIADEPSRQAAELLSRCKKEAIGHGGAGTALATRNAKDFRETGIDLIDPWEQS